MSVSGTSLKSKAASKGRGAVKLVIAVYERYLARHGALVAAGLALYALLAAVPMLAIVLRFVGPLVGEREARHTLTRLARRFLEPSAARTAQELITSASSQVPHDLATVLAFVLAAWASTRLFTGMRELLDGLLGLRNTTMSFRKGLLDELKTRGIAFLLVLASGVLVLVAALIDGATEYLAESASSRMHLPLDAVRAANNLVSAALLIGTITLILRHLPQKRMSWRSAFYGALFAGLATTFVRTPLLEFLSRTGASTALGAAGSAIALLVWLYLVAQLLVLGSALAAELELRRSAAPPQPPRKSADSRSMSTGLLSTTSNSEELATSEEPVSATISSERPAATERARSASSTPLIEGSVRSVTSASGKPASSAASAPSALSNAATSKPAISSHSAVTSRRSS